MSAARTYVTVVSGLPRSGTSLLMQMLAAGGMPLLVDDVRAADLDNPRGYFEYAPVKRIAEDTSFVGDATGRALKVVVPLVRHLPPTHRYRVLLVSRRVAEVIASQERLLARRPASVAPGIAPGRLAEIYAAQLEETRVWLAAVSCPVLDVEHASLMREPAAGAAAIGAFLGGELSCDAMAAVIDTRLHRARG